MEAKNKLVIHHVKLKHVKLKKGTVKPKVAKNQKVNEYQECKKYFEWAQGQEGVGEYLIKHVNEGKRTALMGRYLNLIGMRSGLPDYQMPVANKKWLGLWIEMKLPTGGMGAVTPMQKAWQSKLREAGHYATVAFGADEAIKVTKMYVNNEI